MSRSARLLLASVFLVFPLRYARADSPLTWQECVNIARSKNPTLIAAVKSFEAGRAQYKLSFNDILPQLALSDVYTDHSSGYRSLSSAEQWESAATASIDPLDAAQYANIRTAAANFRLAKANLQVASATLLFNLKSAFAQLLYTQEKRIVAQRVLDIWNQSEQMTALRYSSGSESKGDLMRVKAQLLQAQTSVMQTQRDLRVAQQGLAQYLGYDDFASLEATGTLTTDKIPEHPTHMEDLLEQIPAVQAQEAVVAQAKATLMSAESALLPALSFSYSRTLIGETVLPSASDTAGWSFMGSLNLPIFGGGSQPGGPTATYYNIVAARRNLEGAQQTLRAIRIQALATLESSWDGLAMDADLVKVQQAFLDSDVQRKGEADIMYESGLLIFDNWELIVSDLVSYELSFLQSELNAVNAEATWQQALGKGLE